MQTAHVAEYQKNPIKKWAEDLNRHLSKEDMLSHFSRVRLCATPETAAHQAPPSLGFFRQEHWSGLPFPSPIQCAKCLKRYRFQKMYNKEGIKYLLKMHQLRIPNQQSVLHSAVSSSHLLYCF